MNNTTCPICKMNVSEFDSSQMTVKIPQIEKGMVIQWFTYHTECILKLTLHDLHKR